jgi:hypothetical protein
MAKQSSLVVVLGLAYAIPRCKEVATAQLAMLELQDYGRPLAHRVRQDGARCAVVVTGPRAFLCLGHPLECESA